MLVMQYSNTYTARVSTAWSISRPPGYVCMWEHVWRAAGPHADCCCCGCILVESAAIVTWHHYNTHTVQGHHSAKAKLSRVAIVAPI